MTNSSYTVAVYLNNAEYEALTMLVEKSGKPRNLFIRDLIKRELSAPNEAIVKEAIKEAKAPPPEDIKPAPVTVLREYVPQDGSRPYPKTLSLKRFK